MASAQRGNVGYAPVSGPMTREQATNKWAKTAEKLLKGLPPPPIPPLPAEHASDLSKYKNRLGTTPEEAWQKCADAIRNYDAETCKAYREEMDTLLVFAGLFSAVVTAFTIESYPWLQGDPNDAIIALLAQIAQPGNQTRALPGPKGLPDAVSTRINVYWFLSLALSLSAALTAILCKQWVREFERHADQSHDQFISVRQMKFEGFHLWGVDRIITVVPLLLQSALGLFAVGVVELLWNLHRTVAIAVLVPAAAAFVFYSLTTVLPVLQAIFSERFRRWPQFPFKSPQAMMTLRTLVILSWTLLVFSMLPYLALESLVNLVHMKCLVFCRRVRTYWRPGYLPSSTNDNSASSILQWLLRPWQFEDQTFYDRYDDEPSWRKVGRSLRKAWRYVSSCGSVADDDGESTASSPHSGAVFPLLEAMESWLAMDVSFAKFSDSASSLDGYATYNEYAVASEYCFRAFWWLSEHVYQPGMKGWTWTCVWDMATRAEESDHMDEVDVFRMRKGLFEMTYFSETDVPETSTPCAMALLSGLCLNLEPAFIAEAFIHILPTLETVIAERIYLWIIEHLGNNKECFNSVLHAILSLPLIPMTETEGEEDSSAGRDIRSLLLMATDLAPYYPGTHSQRELACIIAVYYRELCAHGRVVSSGPNQQRLLLLPAIETFFAPGGATPPAEQRAVFAVLARDVDREFEYLRENGPREQNLEFWQRGSDVRRNHSATDVAEFLARPSYRRVYLDLLSDDAHGSTGALKQRFERNIVPFSRRRRSRSSEDRSRTAVPAAARESSALALTSGVQESAAESLVPTVQVHAPARKTDESPSSAGVYAVPQGALHATAIAAQSDTSAQQHSEPAVACAGQEQDIKADVPAHPGPSDGAGAGPASKGGRDSEVPSHI